MAAPAKIIPGYGIKLFSVKEVTQKCIDGNALEPQEVEQIGT